MEKNSGCLVLKLSYTKAFPDEIMATQDNIIEAIRTAVENRIDYLFVPVGEGGESEYRVSVEQVLPIS